MKKYNLETRKYKGLYMEPYTLLKSYVIAVIISIIITLPLYLICLNLIYLYHYFNYVLFGLIVISLIFVYLVMYFKDKYLIDNVNGAKDVNLFYIRMYDMIIVSIVVLIIFGLYLLIF